MQKLSEILLEFSQVILAKPMSKTTEGGALVALLLAQVAWNRAIDRDEATSQTPYLDILDWIEKDHPDARQELRSRHYEGLIKKLVQLKLAKYPLDDRFVYGCGFTPEQNLRVEWDRRKIKV